MRVYDVLVKINEITCVVGVLNKYKEMAVIHLCNIVPTRAVIWIMLFTSCWVVYMVRVNMSLNIIAMVGPKKGDKASEKPKGLVEDFHNMKPADLEDILLKQKEPIIIDHGLKNGSRTNTENILPTEDDSEFMESKLLSQSEGTLGNASLSLKEGDILTQGNFSLTNVSLEDTKTTPSWNTTVSMQTESATNGDKLLFQNESMQPRNRSERHSEKVPLTDDDMETIQPVDKPIKKSKQKEENEQEETFDWSEQQQALILGSYFWIYPVTSLVGGTAAERWGTRSVVFWASVASALFTALGPPAARMHYMAVIFTRVIIGGAGGLVYPACHALIARWVPPNERGKFVAAMQGGTLGTVATWSLSGVLMEKFGWPAAFYCPAALTLAWCLVWCYCVANTPGLHPRITETEKKHIEDALGNRISKTKKLPPYKKIATSIPFIAMVILHYGNLWGLFFIMTVGPKFMASVLGFKLSAAGFVSGLPYLARLLFAGAFGIIGDAILARNLLSTTMIRKVFCIFSHIIPGLLLVFMVYVDKSTVMAVSLITLSMGFNGASTLTNLQNHQDLAPNFAGTLYGIANFIGSSAGFFAPMLTAHFTKDGNTFENWRPVFFVGAAVYIVTALIYFIFGSGEVQPWNFESHTTATVETPSTRTTAPDKGAPQPAQASN